MSFVQVRLPNSLPRSVDRTLGNCLRTLYCALPHTFSELRKLSKDNTRFFPTGRHFDGKGRRSWGPFLKSPEKPFVKLRPAYFVTLIFSYVVKGIKIKITAEFRATRRLRFENTKRIMSPEMHCLITAAPPTELQGQTGAGRGKRKCQLHGNEYVQVQGRVTFITNFGRVALIFRTNWMIDCYVKCKWESFLRREETWVPGENPRSQVEIDWNSAHIQH